MTEKIKCRNCGKEYIVKVIDKHGKDKYGRLCPKCRKMSDTSPVFQLGKPFRL